jgi:hypothetical protein
MFVDLFGERDGGLVVDVVYRGITAGSTPDSPKLRTPHGDGEKDDTVRRRDVAEDKILDEVDEAFIGLVILDDALRAFVPATGHG